MLVLLQQATFSLSFKAKKHHINNKDGKTKMKGGADLKGWISFIVEINAPLRRFFLNE